MGQSGGFPEGFRRVSEGFPEGFRGFPEGHRGFPALEYVFRPYETKVQANENFRPSALIKIIEMLKHRNPGWPALGLPVSTPSAGLFPPSRILPRYRYPSPTARADRSSLPIEPTARADRSSPLEPSGRADRSSRLLEPTVRAFRSSRPLTPTLQADWRRRGEPGWMYDRLLSTTSFH